ncbi:MAG TPA: phenylalanine--tRNA ligase subunit beta [Candidatus Sulfotelmatobacter sp.]|jgi:phenylalanyl-tRNA synthetase beta chain|nr:phenylalanine--tRNA ligase subunit beta [Candidatus Sulfotelmatobacter sp.]
MKVTLNWLKQYVDFNWSPEELTERLTMLGLEVEGVQKISAAFEGIVVAQVITRDKHPNADKLSVCRVNDGTGERQIVCGAQNFKAGDKVPLILPGASLPLKPGDKEPFTIKVGKIRGVESHGMMCSHEELGLDPEAIGHKKEDGLLILREDARVGQPFAEYLGRSGSDVVYDLEVTPNRPDLNSVIGIAREVAALTGNPLKIPVIQFLNTESEPINGLVSVQNDEPELCPRYTARIVRKVKVGPSPAWLRDTLEKVGTRSINNVVDITNYVMLESGQPLHAFDYHLLKGSGANPPKLVIRRAAEGEKFITLDGKERTLTNQMLLIADETKGIALAGVMGGQNTEINANTVDVLIESAAFKPQNIRATSKKLELRSDSSYRFERGSDVGICDWASRRAAQLICDLAEGQVLGHSIDNHPTQVAPKDIVLNFSKSKDLLGIGISHADQIAYLNKLGLETVAQQPGECTFRAPSWRVDLKREVDLIEEIGRLHGIDKIPSTPPRGALGSNTFDTVYDQIAEARRILTGLGLNEAQGQTLISKDECRTNNEELVALANPLSSDMDVLRPGLLPGLIHSLRHNVARKNQDVALFEIGRVFTSVNGQTKEQRNIAIAITGQRALNFWSGDDRDAKLDAYDLKGLVEEFIEQFGLRGAAFGKRTESTALFLESAAVTLGGKLPLGELGQLLPTLAKKYDLRDAVFLAEFNLDLLISKRNPAKSFKALPQFPSSRRDVAMLVPEAVTHEAVLQAVKQAKAANLENVELFDVFRGKSVPDGQKSMAYAFTYRAADKTLTDADVNAAHEKILGALKTQLQAELRA